MLSSSHIHVFFYERPQSRDMSFCSLISFSVILFLSIKLFMVPNQNVALNKITAHVDVFHFVSFWGLNQGLNQGLTTQVQVMKAQVLQVLQTKIDFWQVKLNKYCTNFVQICMQIYTRPVSNKLDCVTVTLNVWFVNKTSQLIFGKFSKLYQNFIFI